MRRTLQWVLILAIPLSAAAFGSQVGQRGGAQRGGGGPQRGGGGPQRGGQPVQPTNPNTQPSGGTPARGRGDGRGDGRSQPSRPPTSVNGYGGSILGTVMRADTNETISRARIDLVRADWAPPAPVRQPDPRSGAAPRQPAPTAPPMLTTTTDEQGRFLFTNVDPGRYTLRAARNQYVRMDYGQRGRNELGTLIVVQRQERVEGIVLRLFLAPTLAGKVTDALGQPMAAATVAAYRLEYSTSGRTLILAKATLSDDRGDYRLFWLTPGDYYLVAGYGKQVAKPLMEGVELTPNLPPQDQAYTIVYYPGTAHVRDAEPVRLSPGLDSFRDIHFRDVPLYRIRGRVVEASTNRAVSGASVLLLLGSGHTGGQEPEPIRTDSNGYFNIPYVAAGSYVLSAASDPSPQPIGGNRAVLGPRLFSEVQHINLSADIDSLVLFLAPPVQIAGRIAFEGILADRDGPTDGLRSFRDLEGTVVNLARRDGGLGDAPSSPLRADGVFTIQDVSPGTYEVAAPIPPGFYIKAIRYSGTDALANNLAIRTQGPRSGTLEIILGPGASMDGRLLERGEPVAGAQIVLVPDPRFDTGRSPDRYKIAASDTTGEFYIRGIAPGRYLAFAFEELEAKFYFDPEFLNRFSTRGVPVQFGENSLARPEIQVITASETEAWNR